MQCSPSDPEECCLLEKCEEQLGGSPTRPRIRVGTSLGMRDEPLNAFLKLHRYDNLATAHVEWVQCPGDLGAISAMLGAGLIDVVALPSEDAVLQVSTRPSLRVSGALRGSPRVWGLMVCARAEPPTTPFRRIAVPEGLAGQIMAAVLAEDAELGPLVAAADQVEHATLGEAVRELAAPNTIDAVLWELTPQERFLLEPLAGVQVLREEAMPWPSHLFVATRETLLTKLGTIKSFLRFSDALTRSIVKEAEERTLQYFMERYELPAARSTPWLAAARWEFGFNVDACAITGPLDWLRRLELSPACDEVLLTRRLAPGLYVCAAQGDSPAGDTEGLDEGSRPPLSGARVHHLMPEFQAPLLCPPFCRFRARAQPLLAAREPPESAELPLEPPGAGPDDSPGLPGCLQGDGKGQHKPVPAG